jgi:hypothetical protein
LGFKLVDQVALVESEKFVRGTEAINGAYDSGFTRKNDYPSQD